eukprot:c1956_g1_i1 orf=84-1496(-)
MDTTSMAPPRKPHVLVLPLPMQSHINPMLNFSMQLASRGGFIITFLNTDKAHQVILEALHGSEQSFHGSLDIRFASMPHGSQEPLPGFTQHNSLLTSVVAICKGMEAHQDMIEEMVVTSRTTSHPITCMISDSTLSWTHTLTTKLGIQRVMFFCSNGIMLATMVEMKSGKLKTTDSKNYDIEDNEHMIAGIHIKQSDFLATLPKFEPKHFEFLTDRLNSLEGTTCIVVNTCKELEGSNLEVFSSLGTKVHYVGPILPLCNDTSNLIMKFYKEDSSCIEWLDKQAQSSVLYVAFGSLATLSPQELEELAFGIEASNQPYLWVSGENNQIFPDGFLDRTSDRGLVVKWAPQIQVLKHVAIGAFLTHCGWNSILESIHMGVPLLCYPMSNDQILNALLISSVWKLGISLLKGKEKGEISREEVQMGISIIFKSQELRAQSTTWKSIVESALQKGGSSYLALERVIDDIVRFVT